MELGDVTARVAQLKSTLAIGQPVFGPMTLLSGDVNRRGQAP
jgi:hypothetical protein